MTLAQFFMLTHFLTCRTTVLHWLTCTRRASSTLPWPTAVPTSWKSQGCSRSSLSPNDSLAYNLLDETSSSEHPCIHVVGSALEEWKAIGSSLDLMCTLLRVPNRKPWAGIGSDEYEKKLKTDGSDLVPISFLILPLETFWPLQQTPVDCIGMGLCLAWLVIGMFWGKEAVATKTKVMM